jgi:calpain-15
LEKAWAKIFGSYMRIEGGTTGEALPSVTGAPATAYIHSEIGDKEAFWKKVYEADKKNYVIATAVSANKSNKTMGQVSKTGLIDSHAYSLIKALEITVNLKTVRLLQIRNPWAQKEWQGDWCDRSNKWTEALRKEVGAEQKDDGVFFISYEDYI